MLALSLSPLMFACGAAASGPIHVNDKSVQGVAIKGYDPVAYFTTGAPSEGKPEFSHAWQGAEWRFASKKNRDQFVADPKAFAPQYGGWCAYAMARGRKVDIDPAAWKIVDGKLYLNYSLPTQGFWLKQMRADIESADKNWERLGADPSLTRLPE